MMSFVKKSLLIGFCIMIMQEFSFSQNVGCGTYTDPADTVTMVHFGNNKILEEILNFTYPNRGGELAHLRANVGYTAEHPFDIPLKIFIYHDDDGSNQSISELDANNLLVMVNAYFNNNATGIQFYNKCKISHINSTEFNNISSGLKANKMWNTHGEDNVLNWHLIYSADGFGGIAKKPTGVASGTNFNLTVSSTGLTSSGTRVLFNMATYASTVTHEAGHALGLDHTHENTRSVEQWNGSAANCFQEAVDRERPQKGLCFVGIGSAKCEVNGDALCDTKAAPNTKQSSHILQHYQNCSYNGGGTDNWGDSWDPPVNNFMSYLQYSGICRSKFSSGQTGVMHATILNHMYDDDGYSWYNRKNIYVVGESKYGELELFVGASKIRIFDYTVYEGANVSIIAGDEIKIEDGTSIHQGADFHAYLSSVDNCDIVSKPIGSSRASTVGFSPKVGSDFEAAYKLIQDELETKKITAEAEKDNGSSQKNQSIVNVQPNPTTGLLTIEIREVDDNTFVSISNFSGQQIVSQNITEQKTIIDLSGFSSGIYIVNIVSNNTNEVFKIMKE